jgi:hypothetical protein
MKDDEEHNTAYTGTVGYIIIQKVDRQKYTAWYCIPMDIQFMIQGTATHC